MGVLDELKREAEQVQAQREEEKSITQVRREEIRRSLVPKMGQIHKYFSEFNDHLNVVAPKSTIDYRLDGLGTLKSMKMGSFKLAVDNAEEAEEKGEIEKFTFHFCYSRDGQHEFKVAGQVAAEQKREWLWNHNLRFKKNDAKDGAVFVVEAYVPVAVEFTIDFDKQVICVRVKNLGMLGASTYTFEPDRMTAELLDELAKFVLGRENRFDELSGNSLTETKRLRIRHLVEEEKRKRETELRGAPGLKRKAKAEVVPDADDDATDEAEAEKRASLGKRLGRVFGRRG